jgi:predicted RNA-binding Zn-ribbon protein involved in translation (DUF1610 family)
MVSHAAHRHEVDEPPRRKATLFCPSCGHESPVEGDWRLENCADRTTYVCPACDTAITERPATEDAPALPERPSVRAARAWDRLLTAPLRLWRVTADTDPSGDDATDCYA